MKQLNEDEEGPIHDKSIEKRDNMKLIDEKSYCSDDQNKASILKQNQVDFRREHSRKRICKTRK